MIKLNLNFCMKLKAPYCSAFLLAEKQLKRTANPKSAPAKMLAHMRTVCYTPNVRRKAAAARAAFGKYLL